MISLLDTVSVEFVKSEALVDYSVAMEFMNYRVDAVLHGVMKNLIWFLEHFEIYTAGMSANQRELKNDLGIPIMTSSRGGKYTYHGPGQRVIYLIVDIKTFGLNSIREYIDSLGKVVIRALLELGITAHMEYGDLLGIWIRRNNTMYKIAAFGIRMKKSVAYHGIAVNISTDLDRYRGIVPCGIERYGVMSVKALGCYAEMELFDKLFIKSFLNIFCV